VMLAHGVIITHGGMVTHSGAGAAARGWLPWLCRGVGTHCGVGP
jgi:hypothetical protein